MQSTPHFSQKQEDILAFPYNDHGYEAVIADGSVRSGKTSVMSIAYILWAMANFNEMNFIIGGRTVGTVQRNVIKPLQRIKYMKTNFRIHYAPTKGYMEIRRGKIVNYFYVFGGINERSQDVVQGGTMAGMFLDEVALMPRSFVEQCIARCSEEDALLWFNCNPEHPEHWFKKEWIDKKEDKKVLYLHFTMDDNPSLSEKVKDRYRRRYSGVFFQRYILGLWTKAEGIIYKSFAENQDKYILDELPHDWKLDYIDVGIDFGGTKSKTKFVLKGVFNNMRDLVILDTYELSGDYTMEELGKAYQDFEAKVKREHKYYFNVYCDNAEPILIRTLKGYAKHSAVKEARKMEVYARIKFTDSMMSLGRFWIYRAGSENRCSDLIGSLNSAVWDAKKENERLDDYSFDVDVLDAMEYSFERDIKKFMVTMNK